MLTFLCFFQVGDLNDFNLNWNFPPWNPIIQRHPTFFQIETISNSWPRRFSKTRKTRKMKNINSGASVPQGRRAFSMAVLDSLATATKKQIAHLRVSRWNPSFFLIKSFGGSCFFFYLGWNPNFLILIFDRRLLFGSCRITKESWIWIIFWSCVSESYSYMILVSDTVKNTTYIHAYIIYICTYTNCIQSL